MQSPWTRDAQLPGPAVGADALIVPAQYRGRMARPGARVCTAARRRAGNAGVLLMMVLVAVAGAVLFSAGSDHHRFDTATAGPVVPAPAGEELSLDGPGDHEHHRGNEWAPTTTNRVRVLAPAVTAVQPRHEETSPSPGGDRHAAGAALSYGGELAQPGVLRV
jgi:hypothetical protein